MKKICNLATIHSKYDTRIFMKECSIAKRYYEVHYITCSTKTDELKDGIHIHGIGSWKSKIARAFFTPFKAYAKAKIIDADVYVLHDPELLLISLLLKKKKNKCVILDCHEWYIQEVKNSQNLPFLLKVLFLFGFCSALRYIVPRLNGVITFSEESVSFFRKYREKNIYLLHNYASATTFKDVRCPDFHRARHILFPGSFFPEVLSIINALVLCKNDVRFILCSKRTISAKDFASILGAQGFSRVDFKMDVSKEELASLRRKCFAGFVIHPSFLKHKECSSNKLFEYMASMLPVIAVVPRGCVFEKCIINNNGHPLGLVVDADPQAIADAIDYLYENKEVARTMGMNGRKAFETKYNFESEADGFLKFLEEVSQSKKSKK